MPCDLLVGCLACPVLGLSPCPAHPGTAQPSPSAAPLVAAERLQVVGHSKTSSASSSWVPWAALHGRETARHTYFKHQCNGLWPIEG